MESDDIIVDEDVYRKGDKEYVRVTRILDVIAKPEFYRWYAKHGYDWCTKYRDDRAVFGTRMHKEFQNWLEDENVWIDSREMEQVFDEFRGWCDLHDVESEFCEYRLFSDELGVAGTCDFIGLVDGVPMLVDWKTSKRVYDNYRLQVSVYLWMFECMSGRRLEKAGVVCFSGGGVRELFLSREECLELLDVFRAAVVLYRWKYGKK